MIRNQLVTILAVVLCGVVAVSAVEPGCRTRYEMRMKWTVQGNYDSYWECSRWGKAVLKDCPTNTLFSAPYQTCVPAKYWEEFPYYAPPTTVNSYDDECTEEPGTCVNPCEIKCNGGTIVDNECVCDEGSTLENGTCVDTGGVDGCENGEWNFEEDRCICNVGYDLIEGLCVPDAAGTCYNAPNEAYAPGNNTCEAPVCTVDEWERNVHLPTRNPRTFWQCGSPGIVHEMPCAPATCFSYMKQTCVHVVDWVNECN